MTLGYLTAIEALIYLSNFLPSLKFGIFVNVKIIADDADVILITLEFHLGS